LGGWRVKKKNRSISILYVIFLTLILALIQLPQDSRSQLIYKKPQIVNAIATVIPNPTSTSTPTPSPTQFWVSIISIDPREIEPREAVTIEIVVFNKREETGTYEVSLRVDGEVEDIISGTLDGGEFKTVTSILTSEIGGMHTVEVEGETETFTVITTGPKTIPRTWIAIIFFGIGVGIFILYMVYSWRARNI